MSPTDNWYQELTLEFSDGSRETLFLDMSRTGTHRPRPQSNPAGWTKLACSKCPCCPLTQEQYCPAAVSLEETLLTIDHRKSTETVTATAADSENRRTSVTWPLQQVGAAFVQLAVFSSGCPIGGQFRPMIRDLRPFSTSRELGKHLVYKHLLQKKGDPAAAAAAVAQHLAPLREVCECLFRRLQAIPRTAGQDAVPNSIVHIHAMTLFVGGRIQELVEEILKEVR